MKESRPMRRALPLRSGRGAADSLFVRARQDPSAFADVWREYHPAVLRYFARRTLNPEAAFDLVAETFLELFATIDRFRGSTEDQGRAWMWRVARSNLYDWIEKGKVERRSIERMGYERNELESEDLVRIEEIADFEGAREVIRAALATLSEGERRVLQLRIVEQREFSEIAEILGASSSRAARQRESKARRRLIDVLDAIEPPSEEFRKMMAGWRK